MEQLTQRRLDPFAVCSLKRQDRARRRDTSETEDLRNRENHPEAPEFPEQGPQRSKGLIDALGFGCIPLLGRAGEGECGLGQKTGQELYQHAAPASSASFAPQSPLWPMANLSGVTARKRRISPAQSPSAGKGIFTAVITFGSSARRAIRSKPKVNFVVPELL
ncbi:hypothetical protein [Roseovarius sp. THAF8]|uniref:hypothetical protein n=1 Tax=Roseovarius sp. THAF8 TaxID=2587846 RepID=UPI0012690A1C|nr:hypothetical protein [Roseovarius sp. THAF8]